MHAAPGCPSRPKRKIWPESRLKELQEDALDKAQAESHRRPGQAGRRPRASPADTYFCRKCWTTTTMREYRQRLTELQRQYAELRRDA